MPQHIRPNSTPNRRAVEPIASAASSPILAPNRARGSLPLDHSITAHGHCCPGVRGSGRQRDHDDHRDHDNQPFSHQLEKSGTVALCDRSASIARIWSANASASAREQKSYGAGATRVGAGNTDLKAERPRRRYIVGDHAANVSRLGSLCTPITGPPTQPSVTDLQLPA